MADQLKEKTARGLMWGAVNNLLTQLLNLAIGIFLGRLLSPGEYGMVGMLAIFSAVAGSLQESGFISAITNMKQPTHRDYNAVFWFSLLMGVFLYALLYFCAPLIAAFFHQPELVPLSRLVFVSFFIAGIGTAHSAYMFRNMMNREKAMMSLAALLTSGMVGITLAYMGYSYWSLAWQQLVYITVISLGRLYYVRWLPSLRIDLRPLRPMFGFSCKILATSIVNQVSNNVLSFIFGRLFTPRAVGNFTQAYKWNNMAYSFVAGTIQQVAQPVFATISDDRERQLRVFRKMMRFTAFLSFPAMLGLALVSREFILITIKDKWLESVPLLQMLCISGAFFPFYTLFQNLAISRGRSGIYMRCNIAQILLQIALVVAVSPWGIQVMVMAYSLFNIGWLAVWLVVARRLIGYSLSGVARDVLPFLLAAVAVIVPVGLLTQSVGNLYVLLAVRVLAVAAAYFLLLKVLHAQILDECMDFLLAKLNIKKRKP